MKGINSLDSYRELGRKAAEARNQNDEARAGEHARHYRKMRDLERGEYRQEANKAYNEGYAAHRNVPSVTYFR